MTDRPDEPQRGREFAPLENTPPADPYAPVDYPADVNPPGPPPPGYPYPAQSGYPPPGGYPPFAQPPGPSGYPPLGGYPPPGYPPTGGYPPPGQPGPYDPYGQPPTPGTSGKAIGALVSAVVGVLFCGCFIPSIVGVILGVIAMAETKRTGQEGHGMALAGVIVGGVSIALGLLVDVAALTIDTGGSTSHGYGV